VSRRDEILRELDEAIRLRQEADRAHQESDTTWNTATASREEALMRLDSRGVRYVRSLTLQGAEEETGKEYWNKLQTQLKRKPDHHLHTEGEVPHTSRSETDRRRTEVHTSTDLELCEGEELHNHKHCRGSKDTH